MSSWLKYVGYPKGTFSFSIYTWLIILLWSLLPILSISYGYVSYLHNVYKKRKAQKLNPDINEVVIVVLGDLGHSPRMTYHAKSFKKIGYHVNLCGYLESNMPTFLSSPDISIHSIPVIQNKRNLPYLLFGVLKVLTQIFDLSNLLISLIDEETRFILIQNPPSLPVLLIIGLIKKYWAPNSQLIIDWHNLNWSILNLKYKNENHPVVKIMKFYEKYCSSKFADFNLTVTSALKKYLINDFGLPADKILTLYDRPSEIFKPLDTQETLKEIINTNKSLFEDIAYNQINDRILITSTSFTADEDLEILIQALIVLDKKLSEKKSKNRILMFVTGKGPLQLPFLKLVNSNTWKNILIKNVWLPIKEYPNILKISDLGISLHYSSSGLDLPMKIVDLFGSGIPVLSMSYPVINELVKDNVNGLIMENNNDPIEMSDKIYNVLFNDNQLFIKLKEGALLESQEHWDDEWDAKLSSILSLHNDNRL